MTEVVIVDGVRPSIARGGKDQSHYKIIRAATMCIGMGRGVATVVEQI